MYSAFFRSISISTALSLVCAQRRAGCTLSKLNFLFCTSRRYYGRVGKREFHSLTEKACKDNSIAIMKQVGDALVVTDDNLKKF